MSPKTSMVFVLSSEYTHSLTAEGLILEGGKVTEIPATNLDRVLQLAGVSEVFPTKE